MQISDLSQETLAALKTAGYGESDIAMLAKTEVDALLAPESSGEEAPDPHDAAAAAQDDATKAAAAAAPAAAPAAAAVVEEEEEEPPQPTLPVLRAEVPPDAAEKIAKLRGDDATEFKRMMDGEIDAETYQKTRARIDGEVDALRQAALTASIFDQMNTQNAEQQARNEWNAAQRTAFSEFKGEGVDYRGKPALLAAYNVNLKSLGADPKNEKRDAAWFLSEAHKLTKADLGITVAAKRELPKNGADNTNELIPPTLRGIPAAANGAVQTDEFAHMRSLTGMALEKAHAAMTEQQRDRWMAE